MKNSVCSQLRDLNSSMVACNYEIILKITCNRIVSVSEIHIYDTHIKLIYR
jgi:hypothetical protein